LDSEREKNLPLCISANSSSIKLDKEKDRNGKSLKILVYPNRSNLDAGMTEESVQMTVAGTMSYTGKLWNLTGQFSKEKFYFLKEVRNPR